MSDARSIQELLPWLVPITSSIIGCKDSGLLAMFEYSGLDADGAPDSAVAQLEHMMDTANRTWRNQPVSIWWTVRRERTNDYPSAVMPDPISQMIDDEHREQFLAEGGFINRYFVSVLWMPERSTNAVIDRIGAYMADGLNPIAATIRGIKSAMASKESFAWGAAELELAIETFEGRLAQFSGTLGTLGLRRLHGDSFVGALWGLANPGMPSAKKAAGHDGRYLDGLLPERPLEVTRDTLVFGDSEVESGRTYLSAISLKEYPDNYFAGLFDALLTQPIEAVFSLAFRVSSNSQVQSEITSAKRAANLTKFSVKSLVVGAFKPGGVDEESADPAKQEQLDDALIAQGELSAGRRYWGWMNATLCYVSPDPDALKIATDEALRALHGSQVAGAVRETIHLLSAWTVTLPGAWEECRRWYVMSDANMSDAAPILSIAPGERWNTHFSTKIYGKRQPALTVLQTEYSVPFYFNWNVGQIAHAFVVGPTRSGKSAGMNFLMSQFRKYPGAKLIIFDRDRSCRIPTLLQGGQHIDIRSGGKIRLNPYSLLDQRQHWTFLADFTEYLICSMGHTLTAEDSKSVWLAIEGMAADTDPDNRRLMGLYNLLPAHLRVQLSPWIEGGRYGEYFDHVEDSFSLSDFTCIEMGHVMQDARLATAVMDYAFYRTELAVRNADASVLYPSFVYIEEASFLMKVPQFSQRLVGWLKTLAKLNAGIVLATQSPEDFMEDEAKTVFAALRDNIPTRIYLPNPAAMSEGLHDLYVKTFQLLPEQVQRIASAIPKRNYFITRPGMARMVTMELTPNQINALRSEADAQRILDECWRDGEAPAGWQQEYMRRVTAWGESSAQQAA
ncbi:VirB4 family type IV secretion system protein [Rhodanobacter sp. 115]|uniref:VirB4 family type IV secretion system protein n=1 Tax=Rhodanobacter sp. FW021-MT20 TaxID=1162282 RepID=UPI0034E56659